MSLCSVNDVHGLIAALGGGREVFPRTKQPRRQFDLHADSVRAAKPAAGGGGNPDRVGDDSLDDGDVWKHYKWVAVAQVPYFIWVSIASVLQLSITLWNW